MSEQGLAARAEEALRIEQEQRERAAEAERGRTSRKHREFIETLTGCPVQAVERIYVRRREHTDQYGTFSVGNSVEVYLVDGLWFEVQAHEGGDYRTAYSATLYRQCVSCGGKTNVRSGIRMELKDGGWWYA